MNDINIGGIMIELQRSSLDLCIVCSNFDDSLNFYHKLLGFEIVAETEIPAEVALKFGLAPMGFRQVRLKAGDSLLKLMEIKTPLKKGSHQFSQFSTGIRWVTFFVKDVQSTYTTLSSAGVHFLSEPHAVDTVKGEDPIAGIVCAVDPDGLLIEFLQL